MFPRQTIGGQPQRAQIFDQLVLKMPCSLIFSSFFVIVGVS